MKRSMFKRAAVSGAALAVIAGGALAVVPNASAATSGNVVCVTTRGQTSVSMYITATNGAADVAWGKCSTNSPYYLRNAQAFDVSRGTYCVNEATGSVWNGGWFFDKTYILQGNNTVTRFRCYHA